MEHDPQLLLNPIQVPHAQEPDRTSTGPRLPVAFLPAGQHTLRWFCDAQGKLLRFLHIHEGRHMPWGKRCRTLCPDVYRQLAPSGAYPPACEICALAEQRLDQSIRCETRVMLYGKLYYTTNTSRYWQANQAYLVITPPEIHAGLAQFLTRGGDAQREPFAAMMNPRRPGPALVMQVQKYPKASVTLASFTAATFPPLTLGAWYRPLRECWLASFSQSDYVAVLETIKAEQPQLS